MNSVLIIGAGQLGSRHLQALALVKTPLAISLIDPSDEALAKAAELFKAANSSHLLSSFRSLDEFGNKNIDIAIIATNSAVRRKVTEEFISKCKVSFVILEKFLFPEVDDYAVIKKILDLHKVKTWVNCPRRMFHCYKEIKKKMFTNSVISVSGSLWGLGCNGIHMLDLIAFLTGETKFNLNGSLIDPEIIKSKREGFIEFTGTVSGSSLSGKHVFTITSFETRNSPFVISIQSGENTFIISETNKKMTVINNTTGEVIGSEIEIPFQSKLTNKIAEELLSNGSCELTSYNESAGIHLDYLNMLLEHMNRTSAVKVEKCLIT